MKTCIVLTFTFNKPTEFCSVYNMLYHKPLNRKTLFTLGMYIIIIYNINNNV